jgi:hypothetical protein
MKYLIGIIIAIILFTGGVLCGKFYFSTQEIKIVDKVVYKTEYKTEYIHLKDDPEYNLDNFNDLLTCYNSPITFQDYTKSDYLHVIASDQCKQSEVKYKIGTKGNWTMYFAIGAGAAALTAITIIALK